MTASARAVSVPGRIGSQASEPADVAVNRGSMLTTVAPLACASLMMRQSGIDVSATLLPQSTMTFELRKSVDSWPSKNPPPLLGLAGSTRT